MKTKFKIIGISICFVVLTSVIFANQNSPSPLVGDELIKIKISECIGCGDCVESGITDLVNFFQLGPRAVWTSTYTRMENNEFDYLLDTAPLDEYFMAIEAMVRCPVEAIVYAYED